MDDPKDIEIGFQQFSQVALEFCQAIDAAGEVGREELLLRVYAILPKLISQGIALPDVDRSARLMKVVATKPSQEEWTRRYEFLRDKLGDGDLYWQVFDPTKHSEIIQGSLADDLADIYRDMNGGIQESDAIGRQDALWSWRITFYSHWGPHAIDALRAIHFLLEPSLS